MSSAAHPLIMKIMASAIATSQRAGLVIANIMKTGDLGIIEKAKNDLQTEADRAAQRCIIASLTKKFPNIKIIGEEGVSDLNIPAEWLEESLDTEFLKSSCPEDLLDIKSEDVIIWVDPLDGTTEFTQGFVEHVTVLIGVAVRDLAIGGVIHQPYFKRASGELGRTIWGLKGLGAGGFTYSKPLSDSFIVTTTRSHSNDVVQSALDALNPTTILRVGGAGYKVLQLIEGTADAYVFASPGCKKWDTCAPEAVLCAAGGQLTDILGHRYKYDTSAEIPNKQGVLATSKGVDHQKIVNLMPESIKIAMNKS